MHYPLAEERHRWRNRIQPLAWLVAMFDVLSRSGRVDLPPEAADLIASGRRVVELVQAEGRLQLIAILGPDEVAADLAARDANQGEGGERGC